MSEPRGWSDQSETSDESAASGYPANADPAYSGQYWAPNYYGNQGYTGQGYGSPAAHPTEQLPVYWQPGTGYQTAPPPPPQPPRSPKWLWLLAAGAVLLVAGLVLALVLVTNSSRESTIVAPATPTTTPRLTAPTRAPATRTPLPTVTIRPAPTTPARPSSPTPIPPVDPGQTTAPTGTETVVYRVDGQGRAINITYVDTGGVMQTEFNVALPWSREVSLSAPAKSSASVAVVNVGRDVTCTVSVDGSQVRQRTGRGLTICSGLA